MNIRTGALARNRQPLLVRHLQNANISGKEVTCGTYPELSKLAASKTKLSNTKVRNKTERTDYSPAEMAMKKWTVHDLLEAVGDFIPSTATLPLYRPQYYNAVEDLPNMDDVLISKNCSYSVTFDSDGSHNKLRQLLPESILQAESKQLERNGSKFVLIKDTLYDEDEFDEHKRLHVLKKLRETIKCAIRSIEKQSKSLPFTDDLIQNLKGLLLTGIHPVIDLEDVLTLAGERWLSGGMIDFILSTAANNSQNVMSLNCGDVSLFLSRLEKGETGMNIIKTSTIYSKFKYGDSLWATSRTQNRNRVPGKHWQLAIGLLLCPLGCPFNVAKYPVDAILDYPQQPDVHNCGPSTVAALAFNILLTTANPSNNCTPSNPFNNPFNNHTPSTATAAIPATTATDLTPGTVSPQPLESTNKTHPVMSENLDVLTAAAVDVIQSAIATPSPSQFKGLLQQNENGDGVETGLENIGSMGRGALVAICSNPRPIHTPDPTKYRQSKSKKIDCRFKLAASQTAGRNWEFTKPAKKGFGEMWRSHWKGHNHNPDVGINWIARYGLRRGIDHEDIPFVTAMAKGGMEVAKIREAAIALGKSRALELGKNFVGVAPYKDFANAVLKIRQEFLSIHTSLH
ncbi:hypothetical protein BDR26DRAFT_981686 [Obelidium mucronatum]|nr:hypothetical protein BDR26DRAFT_981686 [Obelidium mucronatum]